MYHRECCDVVPSPNFGYTRCEITHISQQECEAFLKGGAHGKRQVLVDRQ